MDDDLADFEVGYFEAAPKGGEDPAYALGFTDLEDQYAFTQESAVDDASYDNLTAGGHSEPTYLSVAASGASASAGRGFSGIKAGPAAYAWAAGVDSKKSSFKSSTRSLAVPPPVLAPRDPHARFWRVLVVIALLLACAALAIALTNKTTSGGGSGGSGSSDPAGAATVGASSGNDAAAVAALQRELGWVGKNYTGLKMVVAAHEARIEELTQRPCSCNGSSTGTGGFVFALSG